MPVTTYNCITNNSNLDDSQDCENLSEMRFWLEHSISPPRQDKTKEQIKTELWNSRHPWHKSYL
jgi:hypothetical protein